VTISSRGVTCTFCWGLHHKLHFAVRQVISYSVFETEASSVPAMTGTISEQFVKPWLPKAASPRYLFTDAKVIDPVTAKVHVNSSILIENGHISTVAFGGEKVKISGDIRTYSLKDKYVCPGLIDSHVHISAVPGELDFRHVVATPEQEAILRMTFVCRDMLCRGFTTVRDCGGAPYALKQACDSWLVPGPRLFISGHALSQTGGHGDFRSAHDHSDCASGFVSGLGRVVDGVPECMRVTRDELRRGADFIKIMGGGGVVSPTDGLMNKQFSPEEIRAMVMVAENAHTYVTCHAYTPESIQIAIENGVKGIEHGNLIDRATAKMMAERNCFLTPTLVTYQTLGDPSLPQFLPAESSEKNKIVLAMGLEALKIAKEEGLTLCYGSDLLGPLGQYQLKEFGIRSQILTPLDILQSATINPAKMLRQDDALGRIQPGYKADILILNSNPLEDISVFERPEQELMAVIKDGRICRSRLPGLGGLLDTLAKL
jgi:imidazolonepropionase-like amidohydrolase